MMMSCKATCAPFTAIKPAEGRPCVVRAVNCSAAAPTGSQQKVTRRSVGALLAAVPLLALSSGAARADVGDAIKSLDPSVGTGSEPKIGDAVESAKSSSKDVGKAVAEGLKIPDPLKTVQDNSPVKPGSFGGGPKVPTFGSNPPVDNDKGGPRIPNYAPGQNLGKNSIVEKALTDNSPAKQYMKR